MVNIKDSKYSWYRRVQLNEIRKVKVKVEFNLEYFTKFQRGSRGRVGGGMRGQQHAPAAIYPRERDPVPIV